MLLEACAVALASIQLLSAQADCHPTSPSETRVEFAWQIEGESADRTPLLLEISVVPRDFGPGPKLFAIELAPGTTKHTFQGRLPALTVLHWRIRSQGDDPVTSGTASFESPACAVGDQMGH